MGRFCNNEEHTLCCKNWGVIGLATLVVLVIYSFPSAWAMATRILSHGIAQLIIGSAVFALVSLKFTVLKFEKQYSDDDGNDNTPNLRLDNPGDGNGAGLVALMSDVRKSSLLKTPISWILGKSKRKVGTLYPDGSVGFDWKTIISLARKQISGHFSTVSTGYVLAPDVLTRLHVRRGKIQQIFKAKRSGDDNDFMTFTDQIFKENSLFCLDTVAENGNVDIFTRDEVEALLINASREIDQRHAETLGSLSMSVDEVRTIAENAAKAAIKPGRINKDSPQEINPDLKLAIDALVETATAKYEALEGKFDALLVDYRRRQGVITKASVKAAKEAAAVVFEEMMVRHAAKVKTQKAKAKG